MRITTRIFASGDRSLTRIPMAAAEMKDCLAANGKLDPVKAQLAFAVPATADHCPFVADSSDDVSVYYAALTFLELLHGAYEEVVGRTDNDCAATAANPRDRLMERKMDRGRFVFSRMDIRRTRTGVRVRLSSANPRGIVGNAEVEAAAYTVTCTQLWLRIRRQIPWIEVEADPDTLAEATRRNADAEDRRAFADCPRRVNGYCSPCKTDCKFYRNGKCRFGNETNKTNKER